MHSEVVADMIDVPKTCLSSGIQALISVSYVIIALSTQDVDREPRRRRLHYISSLFCHLSLLMMEEKTFNYQ